MNQQTLKYASWALLAYAAYSFSKKKNDNAVIAIMGAGIVNWLKITQGFDGQISE